jgi:hypothetical protein
LLKNVGIPEYYLGENVEFLGDSWKNQGLGLAISARTNIQNVIPKFENLFRKELTSIKMPISEEYHPEVDDTPLCTDEDSAKYRSRSLIPGTGVGVNLYYNKSIWRTDNLDST